MPAPAMCNNLSRCAPAPMFVASRLDGSVSFSVLSAGDSASSSVGNTKDGLTARLSLPSPRESSAVSWTRPWRTSFLYVRVAPFALKGAPVAVLLAAECPGSACETANFRVMYDGTSVKLAYGPHATCNSGAACFPVTAGAMKQHGATVVVSLVELLRVRVVSMSVIVNRSVVARYASDWAVVDDTLLPAPQLVPSDYATQARPEFTVVAHAAVEDVALFAHHDALEVAKKAISDFLSRARAEWSSARRYAAMELLFELELLFGCEMGASIPPTFVSPRVHANLGSLRVSKVMLSPEQAADACWRSVTAAPMAPPQPSLSPLKAPMLLAWQATPAGPLAVAANSDLVSARTGRCTVSSLAGCQQIMLEYAAAYAAPPPWRTCHLVVRVRLRVTGLVGPIVPLLTMGAATANVPSLQLQYDAGRECLLFGPPAPRGMCVRVPRAQVEAGLSVIVSCSTRGPNRRVALAAGSGTYHSFLLAPGAPDLIPSALVSNGRLLLEASSGVSEVALVAHHGPTDDASRRDMEAFFASVSRRVPRQVHGFLLAAVKSAHISQPAYNNVNSCCPTVGLSAMTDRWPGFGDVVAQSRFTR